MVYIYGAKAGRRHGAPGAAARLVYDARESK
jgi:hypothetical protein